MDFELSDEQRLLRDTIRSFVDAEIRPVAREWEASGRYPEEIVATMAGLGLMSIMGFGTIIKLLTGKSSLLHHNESAAGYGSSAYGK